MNTTPYSERLRYLDAADLDDSSLDFSSLEVRGSDERDLGDLDGFIVDSLSGRVIYAVVDSGGWFHSRHFAVPIGHARLEREEKRLLVNVTRDAVEKFPDFRPSDIRRFSDGEMRAFEQRTAMACCPDDPSDVTGAVQYDTLRHYAQPNWWRSDYHRPERYREMENWTPRERSGKP